MRSLFCIPKLFNINPFHIAWYQLPLTSLPQMSFSCFWEGPRMLPATCALRNKSLLESSFWCLYHSTSTAHEHIKYQWAHDIAIICHLLLLLPASSEGIPDLSPSTSRIVKGFCWIPQNVNRQSVNKAKLSQLKLAAVRKGEYHLNRGSAVS